MADNDKDQAATATLPPEPQAAPAEDRRTEGTQAIKMDLMAQAHALQALAAQTAAEAGRLPEKRLDEMYPEVNSQIFDVLGPDGKVMYRANGNGEQVKARKD